jgi:starch phosphorylase
MKVLVNGGLNLSELDGWWAEAYTPQVGWALGDGEEHGDDPAWDAAEAKALYDLLEKEVIPDFYEREDNGVATKWVTRMRNSMSLLTPRFSANRAVREYTNKCYLPAAAAYHERQSAGSAYSKSLLEWKQALAKHWASLRFGELRVTQSPPTHAIEVAVYFGELPANWVSVQLYADSLGGEPPFLTEMTAAPAAVSSDGRRIYAAGVPASRPSSDYTPRIIPSYSGVNVPLEDAHILWFR